MARKRSKIVKALCARDDRPKTLAGYNQLTRKQKAKVVRKTLARAERVQLAGAPMSPMTLADDLGLPGVDEDGQALNRTVLSHARAGDGDFWHALAQVTGHDDFMTLDYATPATDPTLHGESLRPDQAARTLAATTQIGYTDAIEVLRHVANKPHDGSSDTPWKDLRVQDAPSLRRWLTATGASRADRPAPTRADRALFLAWPHRLHARR